ncbi:hypothetical protein BKA62DRAFT_668438 [Auriculariales sp. MPI-PUGE-AT-0066]|nr:hypothetical protein BKA62DRAFT_668438 [Auriculariales sp. MPI-PUGE-AT-0066]
MPVLAKPQVGVNVWRLATSCLPSTTTILLLLAESPRWVASMLKCADDFAGKIGASILNWDAGINVSPLKPNDRVRRGGGSDLLTSGRGGGPDPIERIAQDSTAWRPSRRQLLLLHTFSGTQWVGHFQAEERVQNPDALHSFSSHMFPSPLSGARTLDANLRQTQQDIPPLLFRPTAEESRAVFKSQPPNLRAKGARLRATRLGCGFCGVRLEGRPKCATCQTLWATTFARALDNEHFFWLRMPAENSLLLVEEGVLKVECGIVGGGFVGLRFYDKLLVNFRFSPFRRNRLYKPCVSGEENMLNRERITPRVVRSMRVPALGLARGWSFIHASTAMWGKKIGIQDWCREQILLVFGATVIARSEAGGGGSSTTCGLSVTRSILPVMWVLGLRMCCVPYVLRAQLRHDVGLLFAQSLLDGGQVTRGVAVTGSRGERWLNKNIITARLLLPDNALEGYLDADLASADIRSMLDGEMLAGDEPCEFYGIRSGDG